MWQGGEGLRNARTIPISAERLDIFYMLLKKVACKNEFSGAAHSVMIYIVRNYYSLLKETMHLRSRLKRFPDVISSASSILQGR